MAFENLGLSKKLLEDIKNLGYSEATPIQEKTIQPIVDGKDIMGLAQTGSGKTASYVFPIIEKLIQSPKRAKMPRALLLAPTRELALQVTKYLDYFQEKQSIKYALLIGGSSMDAQEKALLQDIDIIVATPGRLIDLHKNGKILFMGIQIVVVDEFDRMLDMGFIKDIQNIMSHLPKQRQTIFFSATLPKEIEKMTNEFLNKPEIIKIKGQNQAGKDIRQHFILLPFREKKKSFLDILKKNKPEKALVFCNRKVDVEKLYHELRSHYSVTFLHGDIPQSKREESLQFFVSSDCQYLITSDLAARGLDISSITHVFNYDLPSNIEDYIHRIGRTGRAGKTGKAFSFVSERDMKIYDQILEKAVKSKPAIIDQRKKPANETPSENKKKQSNQQKKFTNKKQNKKINKKAQEENMIGIGDNIPNFLKIKV